MFADCFYLLWSTVFVFLCNVSFLGCIQKCCFMDTFSFQQKSSSLSHQNWKYFTSPWYLIALFYRCILPEDQAMHNYLALVASQLMDFLKILLPYQWVNKTTNKDWDNKRNRKPSQCGLKEKKKNSRETEKVMIVVSH